MGQFPNKDTQFSSENQPEGRGRPLGTKNRSTIVKKWLEVASNQENFITKKFEELTEEDWQILSLIKQGRRGNIQATKLLFDMLYGPQDKNINHSGSISLEQITGMEVK